MRTRYQMMAGTLAVVALAGSVLPTQTTRTMANWLEPVLVLAFAGYLLWPHLRAHHNATKRPPVTTASMWPPPTPGTGYTTRTSTIAVASPPQPALVALPHHLTPVATTPLPDQGTKEALPLTTDLIEQLKTLLAHELTGTSSYGVHIWAINNQPGTLEVDFMDRYGNVISTELTLTARTDQP